MVALPLAAQEKDKEKKEEKKPEPPQVLVIAPFAVVPGEKVTLTIRGDRLDSATEIKFADDLKPLEVNIKSKGAAKVPNGQDAKKIGETQMQVELKLDPATPPGSITFTVANAGGASKPATLLLFAPGSLTAEKESNDGFAAAQPLAPGQTIQGVVHQPKNPDVFKLTGEKGRKVTIDVRAQRAGSALDPILTVYNGKGQFVAFADDQEGSRDPILKLTFPADGEYFVSLQDANDQGGPAHTYLITAKAD